MTYAYQSDQTGHAEQASRRGVVRVLGVLALLASAVLTLWPSGSPAAAEIGGCRSDPVVTLADGTVLDLSAQISDAASDVQQVAYTLHVPAGSAVVSMVSTDGPLGLVERFRIYADAPANTYTTGTAVSTGLSGIAVSATTTVVPPGGLGVSGTDSGRDQQTLPIDLTW